LNANGSLISEKDLEYVLMKNINSKTKAIVLSNLY